jgi:hypothetical protein
MLPSQFYFLHIHVSLSLVIHFKWKNAFRLLEDGELSHRLLFQKDRNMRTPRMRLLGSI